MNPHTVIYHHGWKIPETLTTGPKTGHAGRTVYPCGKFKRRKHHVPCREWGDARNEPSGAPYPSH